MFHRTHMSIPAQSKKTARLKHHYQTSQVSTLSYWIKLTSSVSFLMDFDQAIKLATGILHTLELCRVKINSSGSSTFFLSHVYDGTRTASRITLYDINSTFTEPVIRESFISLARIDQRFTSPGRFLAETFVKRLESRIGSLSQIRTKSNETLLELFTRGRNKSIQLIESGAAIHAANIARKSRAFKELRSILLEAISSGIDPDQIHKLIDEATVQSILVS